MKLELPYDHTSPKSIETFAQKLLNKSLRDELGEDIVQEYSGKGKFGQTIEKLYFLYEPNSTSEPDFPEAGVELKTSPIKRIRRGLVSKERLVFNLINFDEEHEYTFVTSSFWRKNAHLLLMFYLYESEKLDLDYVFKIIRLWRFPEADLKIIKDDWQKIISKIKAGKAHELSEGDTLYLGACPKGANSSTLRSQPFSKEPAMQRAFSLKSKYLNFIIEKSLANEESIINEKEYEKILSDSNSVVEEPAEKYKKLNLEELEPVIKTLSDYRRGETFEDVVIKKFTPFYGLSISEIENALEIKPVSGKGKLFDLSRAILGVKKKKVEEFEKGEIQMKTIRLKSNGTPNEHMSFPQIQFKEIINEEWEESFWFDTLTKRFFFVVFQIDGKGLYRLLKVLFWNMPYQDLQISKVFWEDTKNKIINEDFDHFIKISDHKICHVRPKGATNKDVMETASGRMEKKKAYWLNAGYIKEIIK